MDSGELDSGRKVIVDAKTSSMFGFILQLLPNLIWYILILNVKSKGQMGLISILLCSMLTVNFTPSTHQLEVN